MFWRKPHPLAELANDQANRIRDQLTRLDLCQRSRVQGREVVLHRVEFVEPLRASENELRIEVDVSRLPRGVTIARLRSEDVLDTLGAACRCPVRVEYQQRSGFWYVVELVERRTMPRKVRFADMELPAGAPPLCIPIGVGENGTQVWEDLRSLPHLLVGGATQQGKSVFVNALLCQLVRHLGPERLRLYLVDLKGGMELSFFEDLPHVARLVTRNVEMPGLLQEVQAELDHRTELLRGVARDIEGYNHQIGRDQALPYVLLVVDEIANAMLCSDKVDTAGGRRSVSSATESILADLAARARAVGIHLIVSTQRPSVDVVTGLIKANFPARIAFGTASDVDSRVIIDADGAQGLPAGRMLFRRNMHLLELQGPYLSDRDVQRLVDRVRAAAAEQLPAPPSQDDLDRRDCGLLLQLASASFGGDFPLRKLAQHPEVASRSISRNRVEQLAARLQAEGVLRSQGGPKPRVIAVPDAEWQSRYPCVLRPASSSEPAPAQPLQPARLTRDS